MGEMTHALERTRYDTRGGTSVVYRQEVHMNEYWERLAQAQLVRLEIEAEFRRTMEELRKGGWLRDPVPKSRVPAARSPQEDSTTRSASQT